MDRSEPARFSAQHALLQALRRLCPESLADLRDRPPSARPPVAKSEKGSPPLKRSKQRIALIRAAQRRVHAMTVQSAEKPVAVVDFDAWAKRWHLEAIRDLAPHLRAYWRRRPAAGMRFYFPKIRPLAPPPQVDPSLEPHDPAQPIVAAPERESVAAFVARVLPLVEN